LGPIERANHTHWTPYRNVVFSRIPADGKSPKTQ
jgi:hypothetical protein